MVGLRSRFKTLLVFEFNFVSKFFPFLLVLFPKLILSPNSIAIVNLNTFPNLISFPNLVRFPIFIQFSSSISLLKVSFPNFVSIANFVPPLNLTQFKKLILLSHYTSSPNLILLNSDVLPKFDVTFQYLSRFQIGSHFKIL